MILVRVKERVERNKGKTESHTTMENCSMTSCFSFDVLTKLNPIQVNIEGGGPP